MPPDLHATLSALADPTRRAIVDLVRRRPQRPSEVADALALSRPALSRHLRVLRRAGLIDQRTAADDARARVIRLRRRPFDALRRWLDEVESFWGDQLGAFKAHVEGRPRARRR